MNVYDSDRMIGLLHNHGYTPTNTVDDADLVILNTCHIREKAAEKVYSELGRLNHIRQDRQKNGENRMMIAVAGCVAQAESSEMVDRAPYVDIVVGPQSYHRLPELLAKRQSVRAPVVDTEFPIENKFDKLSTNDLTGQVSSFLTIQEGCDKFCTFCVVPYTRGSEESRPVSAILDEARSLVRRGTKEITLLGQNVNAYHGIGPDGRDWTLGRLIQRLAEIDGLARLRYTTSHPADMDDELIIAHRDVPALMPYLHLPVQSGSDRVLRAMNRRYTSEDYRHIIERLRNARPDIALSSDFIVGFPGESDDDFQATLDLVDEVGFAQSYSFKYSRRPGTPASAMMRQISEPVKKQRLSELQDLLSKQEQEFSERCVGRKMLILFDRPGRHAGQLVGRSPYLQAVHAYSGDLRVGDLAMVEIMSRQAHSLAGEICAVEKAA